MTLRLISVCAVVLSIGLILHSPAEAKESKEVCHSAQVSHDAWKALLKRYVKQGSVDYRKWHKAKADRRSLKSYIEKLGGYCKPAFKGLSKKAQLASLINLYNAAVIDLVLRHYPEKILRHLRLIDFLRYLRYLHCLIHDWLAYYWPLRC